MRQCAWYPQNPASVEVGDAGLTGRFELQALAQEATPDQAGNTTPGDISRAVLRMALAPEGGGEAVASAECAPAGVTGTGYDAVLAAVCAFEQVPAGRYVVQVKAGGGYYTGAVEGRLKVGPVTGSVWLPWIAR